MPRPVFARDRDHRRRWRRRGSRRGRTSSSSTSVTSHFESTTSVEQCALRATSATERSWSTSPSLESTRTSATSARSAACERAQLRVVLDPLALLALAPQAGGVDEHEGPVAALGAPCRSRRASCPARRRRSRAPRRASALSRLDLPTFGRPRIATRIASCADLASGRCPGAAHDRVEQVAGAVAVHAPRAGPGRRARAGGTRARARPAAGSSILFASRTPACAARRRIAASSSSPGVIPARASTTNRTRSASAIAARACSAISA